MEYLDNYSFFKVTGGIKDTLWTRWALILFMYALLSKTGSIASSLMSGAIASFGIGANAMAGGVSRMTSAPGRLIGGDINKASSYNAQTKNGKENGIVLYIRQQQLLKIERILVSKGRCFL